MVTLDTLLQGQNTNSLVGGVISLLIGLFLLLIRRDRSRKTRTIIATFLIFGVAMLLEWSRIHLWVDAWGGNNFAWLLSWMGITTTIWLLAQTDGPERLASTAWLVKVVVWWLPVSLVIYITVYIFYLRQTPSWVIHPYPRSMVEAIYMEILFLYGLLMSWLMMLQGWEVFRSEYSAIVSCRTLSGLGVHIAATGFFLVRVIMTMVALVNMSMFTYLYILSNLFQGIAVFFTIFIFMPTFLLQRVARPYIVGFYYWQWRQLCSLRAKINIQVELLPQYFRLWDFLNHAEENLYKAVVDIMDGRVLLQQAVYSTNISGIEFVRSTFNYNEAIHLATQLESVDEEQELPSLIASYMRLN